jgi:hypothetical protein
VSLRVTLKDSNRQSFSASQSVISFFLSHLVQLIRNPAGGRLRRGTERRRASEREKEKVSAAKARSWNEKKAAQPSRDSGQTREKWNCEIELQKTWRWKLSGLEKERARGVAAAAAGEKERD